MRSGGLGEPGCYRSIDWRATADGRLLRRFAGALCDKMGFRTASFTFLTFIFLGQMLVATSATVDSYYLLLAGRFVFALGGEGYTVADCAPLRPR